MRMIVVTMNITLVMTKTSRWCHCRGWWPQEVGDNYIKKPGIGLRTRREVTFVRFMLITPLDWKQTDAWMGWKHSFIFCLLQIVQIHFLLKAQGWEGAAYGHSLSPPPHAKPGKPAGKATARGIKPHVMFSYVWIYGSKMCTLHTNVSSKTPSRSPQGSAHPVVGGCRNVWQKLNF